MQFAFVLCLCNSIWCVLCARCSFILSLFLSISPSPSLSLSFPRSLFAGILAVRHRIHFRNIFAELFCFILSFFFVFVLFCGLLMNRLSTIFFNFICHFLVLFSRPPKMVINEWRTSCICAFHERAPILRYVHVHCIHYTYLPRNWIYIYYCHHICTAIWYLVVTPQTVVTRSKRQRRRLPSFDSHTIIRWVFSYVLLFNFFVEMLCATLVIATWTACAHACARLFMRAYTHLSLFAS